jgi:hypothetical protein
VVGEDRDAAGSLRNERLPARTALRHEPISHDDSPTSAATVCAVWLTRRYVWLGPALPRRGARGDRQQGRHDERSLAW